MGQQRYQRAGRVGGRGRRPAGAAVMPLLAGLVAIQAAGAPRAAATTFTPATTADLVAAINAANDSPEGDVIDLGGGTFELTAAEDTDPCCGPGGLPAITSAGGSVTLRNGTIRRADTAPEFRLVRVAEDAELHLEDMELTGGGGTHAGAVYVRPEATVSVIRSHIHANRTTGPGGAFINFGTLTITDSTVSDNVATDSPGEEAASNSGGAIRNGGSLTIERSTFAGNTATSAGGGVLSATGELTIRNSTFVGNHGVSFGGALDIHSLARVEQSTFAANSSEHGSALNVGGGAQPKASLSGNIFAGEDACSAYDYDQNVTATVNLSDSDSCEKVATVTSTEALGLGALAPNGGPTETVPLAPASAAVDAGDQTACAAFDPPHDQRGSPRIVSGACDAGAYELLPDTSGLVLTKEGPATVRPGASLAWTISLANEGGFTGDLDLVDTLPAGVTLTGHEITAAPVEVTCTPAETTLTCDVAPLGADPVRITVTGTVGDSVAGGTELENVVDVAGRQATATTTVLRPGKVTLTDTGPGPGPVVPGDEVPFTLTAVNDGDATDALVLTATFPDGLTVDSHDVEGDCQETTTTLTCGIDLAAGAERTFTVTGLVPAAAADGAAFTHIASLRAADAGGVAGQISAAQVDDAEALAEAEAAVTVGYPDLAVSVTGPDSLTAGDSARYTVTVANPNSTAAADAGVTVDLPAGAELGAAEAPTGWACDPLAAATTAGQLACRASSLPAGAEVTLTLTLQFPSDAAPGPATLTTRATTASYEGDATNNTAGLRVVLAAAPEPLATLPATGRSTHRPLAVLAAAALVAGTTLRLAGRRPPARR